ncbi:hypothetical protein BDK51DRAFT_27583 [Blyttiomyces helicus]|uniref:Uncharacterized protein n=1 Tax=Blyttiomyces helicus TaxID=388810 RepID=A0A4P9W6J3_9FUNG|nr:hypothetical protein BDK51DRAFT_27583 [Blyttiomyces helicus]|eukprot:RKO86558.1 hypothetical protein BDK51DRAFT_27583 [Blyttiomyces helicus]
MRYPTALAFLSAILSLVLGPLLAGNSLAVFWPFFRDVPSTTRVGVVVFMVLFGCTALLGTVLQSALKTAGRTYFYAFQLPPLYPYSCNFSVGSGSIVNDLVHQINMNEFVPFQEHYFTINTFSTDVFVQPHPRLALNEFKNAGV